MSQRKADDAHLRSIREINGYHIHASDGEVGHVADVLVDDDDWSIHYLVSIRRIGDLGERCSYRQILHERFTGLAG
jgi:hypothetical protein